jgi:hypothetical protein
MVLYGDIRRRLDAYKTLAELSKQAPDAKSGRERRFRFFLSASEWAQGVIDEEFARTGHETLSELHQCALSFVLASARLYFGEKRTSYVSLRKVLQGQLKDLRSLRLPNSITVKTPEGYAFYALYPEQFFEAARAWQQEIGGAAIVIGLRSIGVSLAAAVAAGIEHCRTFVTVRPAGPPFERKLLLGEQMKRNLLSSDPENPAHFLIVDEGPGLSGSSFESVSKFLSENEIPPERIFFFPSHSNSLGPMASEAFRAQWSRARKRIFTFDQLREKAPFRFLSPRFSTSQIQEISAGAWREIVYKSTFEWPPVFIQQEKRKYLKETPRGGELIKFVGVGAYADEKIKMSKALSEAGWVPSLLGSRKGFSISRWLGDASPLQLESRTLQRIGEYLSFRIRSFPAHSTEHSASPRELFRTTLQNLSIKFGRAFGQRFAEEFSHELSSFEKSFFPVRTDGRMHFWEWKQRPDGTLLKTDAVDHHQAHDFVGCQDPVWDLVGAQIELGLSDSDFSALVDQISFEVPTFRPSLGKLGFYRICYLVLQLAYWGQASDGAGDLPERARLRIAMDRYESLLTNLPPFSCLKRGPSQLIHNSGGGSIV